MSLEGGEKSCSCAATKMALAKKRDCRRSNGVIMILIINVVEFVEDACSMDGHSVFVTKATLEPWRVQEVAYLITDAKRF
jgi:hypothetical protein